MLAWPRPKSDPDANLGARHGGPTRLLGVARIAATVADDQRIPEPDAHPVDVEPRQTRSPHGGQNATPVGVRGEERRLDQGRMGDGIGDAASLPAIGGLFNHQGHQLGCPLPIAHDGGGQFLAQLPDRATQGPVIRRIRLQEGGIAQGAGGGQDAGVIGGGVAIHRDRIEGGRHRLRQAGLQEPPSTATSVAKKASMVAMSGRIMPAPLAMPVTTARRPAITKVRETSLGRVSVVMMARAARGQASASRPARAAGRAAARRSTGKGSPITPVEKGSTASALQAARAARAAQLASASARPR